MTEKESKIVEAAIRVFSRYGVKRATMNDVAEEAGIVRQTLYLSFPSKSAVLRAAIRHYAEQIVEQIRADWSDTNSLPEKLDVFFARSVFATFQLARTTPDFEDLANGYNEEGRAENALAHQRFAKLLEEAFAPYTDTLLKHGQTPQSFAEFVQLSAHQLKHAADDEEHLHQLLSSLRAATLCMTIGHAV